ncbi:hypothetical protein [Oleiharenicola sp. Vm1]|uniref:hypothetical protein n=1 Tax=Oleiharenicola sp. Vm1 TaxID=3398393 RepID=UPI0039F63074
MKRPLSSLAALSFLLALPLAARAAYYNTYTTVATLPNANSCAQTQGFDTGSTYAYSVKVSSDNARAIILRTAKSDGSTTLMTNGDNGTTYATYLDHANDLTLSSINGDTCMFVTTMTSGSLSLVKLLYSGSTYYKVGNYTLSYDGNAVSMSGIKKIMSDTNNDYFLFKSGLNYYWGTVPKSANSGTITLTHGFTINIVDALVNGSTVPDITSYLGQGIGYSFANDRLFVPLTYQNVSIVLVYENVTTASGTITSNPNLSFRITSSTYSNLFEIESCSVEDGKLYFNCNRRTDKNDTAHDAVCYFNGYVD